MLIGELAERAGTSTRTLRYYEEQGLVQPRRDAHGYRQYDDGELRVVHEIRALLAVGFGLGDIKPFVECLRAGNTSGDVCPDSVAVLDRKLVEVEGYLEQLIGVRDHLRDQLTRAIEQRETDHLTGTVEHQETRCPKTSSPSPMPPSPSGC